MTRPLHLVFFASISAGAPSIALAGEPAATETPEPGPPMSLPEEPTPVATDPDSAAPTEAAEGEPIGAAPAGDAPAGPETSPPPPAAKPRRRVRARDDEPLLEVTPRQFFLGLGWAHNVFDKLPDALIADMPARPHGVSIFTDYLWQVGGLGRRWPSWLGFHLGVDVFPATAVSRQAVALSYGLYVKHGLGRHPKVRPFVAYGLGAVQAFVKTIDGRGIGHQTRLSVGVDVPIRGITALSFELTYKYQTLPTFRREGFDAVRWDFHTVTALAGVLFDFPRRFKGPRKKRRKG